MNRRQHIKGQALVELALVFPFFLLIIVGGIIDFGFIFYNQISLQQIANDTAQWAAERDENEAAILEYGNSLKPGWWSGPYTVHPQEPEDLVSGGKLVKVMVTYECPTYTPFYQTIFNATSGNPTMKLSAMAAYKIPENLKDR